MTDTRLPLPHVLPELLRRDAVARAMSRKEVGEGLGFGSGCPAHATIRTTAAIPPPTRSYQ
jgi:hypothetical protein